MATNIDVTLKRYNGTDYDQILPTTHLGQIYTDSTLTENLGDFLDDTYINVDQIGAAGGLATLDANQKLTISQLPTGITGGLKFRSALSVDTDLDTLGALYTVAEDAQGSYWIATADIVLTSTANSTVLEPGDEGDFTPPINIEAGDWVVLSNWAENDYTFAIINNTYQNATTTENGIVKLSDATTVTGMTGNDVITEGILAGLIGTGAGDIAAGDHLHDDRYYTETEVGNYFAGNTAITGYNKTNWDTAYGWGDHSVEGYLTEESLADLTDTTLTSLAANDILRYNGTAWVNDGNFKPILYGTGQTSSITGAIIIETD